jgi:hypothetical protein
MRHHYVPKFMLKRWAFRERSGQVRLPAFYWDERQRALRMFPAGYDQVCCGEGLFAFQADHPDGRDAIETKFFRDVDNNGAKVIAKIIERRGALSALERLQFAGFLLSLDARRPKAVQQVIEWGSNYLTNGFDQDPKITEVTLMAGENRKASEVWADITGHPMEDQALLLIQSMTTNMKLASTLTNWPWMVRYFDEDTIALSDRPLIRVNSIHDPSTIWALPLNPRCVWFGSPRRDVLENLEKEPLHRLRNLVNSDSAMQADRYVFTCQRDDLDWLKRRLSYPQRRTGPEITQRLFDKLGATQMQQDA